MPKTPRRHTVHPLTLREVEVVKVVDLTPGMRRITLAGAQLRSFTSANSFPQPAFASSGFDDNIRLVFCYPGHTEPVLPVQKEGGVDLPKTPRPLSRVYTVRRWDPDAGELDVEFVKHGIGVGTTWAYRAQVGARIQLYGPSASRALPSDADWLLVAGDETALPAISRLLEELPDDARARVLVEIAEESHRLELRGLPHVEITWLVRASAEAGTTTLLRDAVPGGRVLLIEEVFDTDDLDEHDGEADLLALTCHGSGLRTAAELDAVIARAGLVRSTTHTVGWGATVHGLVRAET